MVKFWLSGSLRVRAGVKTSLVTDSEKEIVLTAPYPRRLRLDGTVAPGYGTVKT